MNPLTQTGLVALGAASGGVLRYWVGYFTHASTKSWPWPTLAINVVGSLILGLFAAAALERGWGDGWKLLVAVGFCGGFTTFSTFSFETVDLILRRDINVAFQYILASVLLCIGGCWLGVHFGRLLFAR
jgi:CrcB protein